MPDAGSFDPDGDVLTVTQDPPGPFGVGLRPVTVTVTDGNNDSSTCTGQVQVTDCEAPLIDNCPSSITHFTGPGNTTCDAQVSWTSPVAFDNCGVASFTSHFEPGDFFFVGSTRVAYIASDAAGNGSLCRFEIDVVDNTPPPLVCPSDKAVVTEPGLCTAVVNNIGPATFPIDNCGITTLTYATHGEVPESVGGGANDASGATFYEGVTTVTYTSRDSVLPPNPSNESSCEFRVTLLDNQPPVITCPTNKTVSTDPGVCTALVNSIDPASALDNCSGATVAYTLSGATTGNSSGYVSGLTFKKGTTKVTYTITDTAVPTPRTASCSFDVTVEDRQAPLIECPGNTIGDTFLNLCVGIVNGIGPFGLYDNCPGATVAYELTGDTTHIGVNNASGLAFNKGTTTVTYTISDAAIPPNTTSCSFEVNMVDDEAPKIACPGNRNVVTEPGLCMAVVQGIGHLGTSDNCFGTTVAYAISGSTIGSGGADASGATFKKGTTTVTYTVSDSEIPPNMATCTLEVTVEDNQVPIVACPDDITLPRGDFACTDDLGNWMAIASATDNCDPVLEVLDDLPGCGIPYGRATPVTWSVRDQAGNESSCSANIAIDPASRTSASTKGSFLTFAKVELRWDANGKLIQDTTLTLTNDFPGDVHIKLFFVNGDAPTDAVYLDPFDTILIERAHNGWNQVDCGIELSENESTYLVMSTGVDGCQRFSILDPGTPPGRFDFNNLGDRVLRGFVYAFAINEDGHEITWNHLSGHATIVNYHERSAWDYQAFAFATTCQMQGEEPLDCTTFDEHGVCCEAEVIPGRMDADGFQYDYAFNTLLFDFFAVGSTAFSNGGVIVMLDTDLTLHPVSQDLRQDSCGPITTKAHFDIWNANEDFRSGPARCITCWDQTLLSAYSMGNGLDNNFILADLGTDKGKARIDGMASFECDNLFVPPTLDDAILQLLLLHDRTCDPNLTSNGTGGAGDGTVAGLVEECCFYSINDSLDAALLGVAAKALSFSGDATGRTWAGMNLVGAGQESAQILFDVPTPPETATTGSGRPGVANSPRDRLGQNKK